MTFFLFTPLYVNMRIFFALTLYCIFNEAWEITEQPAPDIDRSKSRAVEVLRLKIGDVIDNVEFKFEIS